MVKDGDGHFYTPENDFNNIPDFNPLESYLVKVNEDVTLELEGYELYVEDSVYEFHEGEWSHFSYLLDEEREIEEIFGDYVEDVYLIKDGDGKFWLPRFNFNNIGNMVVGNGYMIKPLHDFEFSY